jgi:hypothetical protein
VTHFHTERSKLPFWTPQSESSAIQYETVWDGFHRNPSVQFGEKWGKSALASNFVSVDNGLKNLRVMWLSPFFIGCKEYPHSIIIFECTLCRPPRKPKTVLPTPSPRRICRNGELARTQKVRWETLSLFLSLFSLFWRRMEMWLCSSADRRCFLRYVSDQRLHLSLELFHCIPQNCELWPLICRIGISDFNRTKS